MRPLFGDTQRAGSPATVPVATPRTRPSRFPPPGRDQGGRPAGRAGRGGAARAGRPRRRQDTLGPARGRGLGSAKSALGTAPPGLSGFVVREPVGRLPSGQAGPGVPALCTPTSCRCSNYSSRHPLRCGLKAKTNSRLRGCCPPPGAPSRSPPLRRPPARWGSERPRLSLGLSSSLVVGRARGRRGPC